MRNDQELKLAQFKAKLRQAHIRQIEKEREEILLAAFEKLSHDMDTFIEMMAEQQSPAINVTNTIDTKELSDALTAAVSKFNTQPNVEVTPVINVAPTVVNEDVYARYKRFNSSTDPDGTYHGFVDADGNWFIQRETNFDNKASSRYATGEGTLEDNWAKRTRLSYKPFDQVEIP